jgi:hypothetical protein
VSLLIKLRRAGDRVTQKNETEGHQADDIELGQVKPAREEGWRIRAGAGAAQKTNRSLHPRAIR